MPARESQPIETPLSQRMVDFRLRVVPLIVWSVCALIVAGMLLGRASRFDYVGLAQALEYPVSPVATGTVQSVVVDIYDRVDAGEMVAKLDDSQLLASIAIASAEIVKLQAELESERATLLTSEGQGMAKWAGALRRFQADEQKRRLDVLSLRVVHEERQIELERMEIEEQRAKELLDAGVIAETLWDQARLQRDEVRRGLEEGRVLLEQTEAEYFAAKTRREEYETGLPNQDWIDPILRPLREAIEVESLRLDEIDVRRQALILRSPVAGQVSNILCRRGQSVRAGEPVVVVAEGSVREIVAFLAEDDGREIAPSTPVVVSTRGQGGTVSESVVIRVGPSIQELPPRLWRNPRRPDYGRAVIIAAVPGMRLTPGEVVNVKFLDPR
jgi:multidrug resistance efflux pump